MMNDEDLRDLFAGMAMISRAWVPSNMQDHAKNCYALADAMLEAKYANDEPEEGITAIKRNIKEES
jgi:hypothetical protein